MGDLAQGGLPATKDLARKPLGRMIGGSEELVDAPVAGRAGEEGNILLVVLLDMA